MPYPCCPDTTAVYEDTVTGEPFIAADLPLQVCMSAAGYYIGQLEPCGCPFDRHSGYFPTKEAAQAELDAMQETAS